MVNCCVERWASFFCHIIIHFYAQLWLHPSHAIAGFSEHSIFFEPQPQPIHHKQQQEASTKKWGKWLCSSCLLRSFSLGVSWLVFVAPFRGIMDNSAHSMFLVSLHQPTSVNSNSKHLATVRGENKHSSHLFMWVFWSNTCSFFVASLQNISVFGSFCVLLFWFFVCRMFIFYPLPQSMVNCLCWEVSLTWEWNHYDMNMNWFMYITYFI